MEKLKRVCDVLKNVTNHFGMSHRHGNSFDRWEVEVEVTSKGLKIDMCGHPAWKNHGNDIKRALGMDTCKEHDF